MPKTTRLLLPILKAGPKIYWYYLWKMIKYAKHPEKYPIQKKYLGGRKLALQVSKDLNVKYYFEGLENIPTDRVSCFVGNHSSDFDPVLLVSAIEKPTTFVGKKEIGGIPFVGTFMKSLEGEFMDRDDLKQSLRVMKRVEEDLLSNKKNWVIFPEGTRNRDPQKLLLEFHQGTFRAPTRAGVPIVPFAMIGASRVLKSYPNYKVYPVVIKFLKPIYKEEYELISNQELANIVKSQVQREITFNLRAKDHKLMQELNPTKYKFI